MVTTRAKVNPDVLRWARELGGFTIEDIAKATNTKAERVEQWEAGQSQPTLNQLREIAWRLRRPPAFFFRREAPRPDLPQPPDYRRIEERHEASVELRRDLRSAIERRARYLELAGADRWDPGIDLADNEPETAAATARARLGITVADQTGARDAYQTMHMWIEAVERLGAIVFQSTAFALDEARGASVYFDQLPIVLVNAKDPIVARSFTLLHELGHLCMGSGALCEVYGRSLPNVETRCNRFAAAVLMPAQAFLAELSPDPADDVGPLARRYKVSEEAAAIRLYELGRIDRATLDRIRAETRMRVAERERQDADKSPIVPYSTRKLRDLGRNYVGTVLDAYHDDRMSLTEVSQALDVKVPHIWKMQETLEKAAESRS